nr:hypothetical protein CTI12_AA006670 [Tanacetum cinerariifolium]
MSRSVPTQILDQKKIDEDEELERGIKQKNKNVPTPSPCEEKGNWRVVPSSESRFEVMNGYEGFKVDERLRACTCRAWQLTGIPCQHGIAALYFLHREPGEYVSEWYREPARGGKTATRGGSTSAKSGKTTQVSSPSSPSVGFEMSVNHDSGIRIKGGVYIGGGSQSGNSPARPETRSATNEAERTGPIGYGVSWDPINGVTMLGDSMGILRPTWLEGITPQDGRIHVAESQDQVVIPLSSSQPLASQEELQYEEPVHVERRVSERDLN